MATKAPINPRRLSRELALLSLSQINQNTEIAKPEDIHHFLQAAIRTLKDEIHEALESATSEVIKGSDHLVYSETRAVNVKEAKTMVQQAITLTQSAINRLGAALELPEFIQMSNQSQVREYTIEVIQCVLRRTKEIEETLESSIVEWQLNRISRIDRDILRIAVAEILYLDVPKKVAINEAVELAKRYSDEDGYRFINGLLRRVTEKLKNTSTSQI